MTMILPLDATCGLGIFCDYRNQWFSAMAINAKQERFCLEYTKDLNATQAAKRAGYSEKTAYSTGSEILKKPEIKARVEQLLSERSKKNMVDAQWVMDKLKYVAERCMDGEEFNASGANRAIELLGKHVGVKAFQENIAISGTVDLSERLARAKGRTEDLFSGARVVADDVE